MAEQGSGKSAEDGEPSIDEDPLETCRKNLESARKTLQAFDDLDKRWKVKEKREREKERMRMREISPLAIMNTGSPAKVCRYFENISSECIWYRSTHLTHL